MAIFTESYTSPEQVITPAGQLILAHGLSSAPKLISVSLICKIAEQGYAVGDKLIINPGINDPQTGGRGISLVIDSTNLTIRYGNLTKVFQVIMKNTGGTVTLTDIDWRLVLEAYA